jgi:mRNA-degrading endonuclease RelE of RelBE toxin-antitoxin system
VPEVRFSRRAADGLDSLPQRTARRIADPLRTLAEDPRSPTLDIKVLVGRRPWRRLRLGDHRILFRPAQGGNVLLVGRVVDRRELDRAVRSLPD